MKKYITYLMIICTLLCIVDFGPHAFIVKAEATIYDSVVYGGSDEDFPELERLLLAKLVYDDLDGFDNKLVADYVVAKPELYAKEIWNGSGIRYDVLYSSLIGDWKIKKIFNHNKVTGFYAVAFEKGNEIVLAFRGSEMFTDEFALDESNDWIATDFKFALFNKLSGQFKDAEWAYNYVQRNLNLRNNKNISFAGHSLGGALVTYASLVSGVKGYAFDGACGHVIDLVYYFNYLDIDTFEGVEKQNFCNYTDSTGYVVADLIQHTNADWMYQIDHETYLDNLSENTLIPKLSDAGSHIAWSSIIFDGNVISLTEQKKAYEPSGPLTLDITKNIIEAGAESLDFKHPLHMFANIDYGMMVGSLFGAVKDGRVMLASTAGGEMKATNNAFFSQVFGYNSILFGGIGDDDLYGSRGDDVLIAGLGDNVLYGRKGIDTYIIDSNPEGKTSIVDEGGAESIIILRNMGITSLDREQISRNDFGLCLKDGTTITLEMNQTEDKVEIYSYNNGRLAFLGTYGDVY